MSSVRSAQRTLNRITSLKSLEHEDRKLLMVASVGRKGNRGAEEEEIVIAQVGTKPRGDAEEGIAVVVHALACLEAHVGREIADDWRVVRSEGVADADALEERSEPVGSRAAHG